MKQEPTISRTAQKRITEAALQLDASGLRLLDELTRAIIESGRNIGGRTAAHLIAAVSQAIPA